jgi:leishmanolysin-like peptidase
MGNTDSLGNTKYCTSYDTDCVIYTAGTGVENADFLIYVTSQTVGSCPVTAGSGTLAFAASCRADQYDRPIVGYVNFCPVQIDETATEGSTSWNTQLTTAIHEITHALGFSSSKFSYYRDHANGGQPHTSRNSFGQPNLGEISPWGTPIPKPATTVMTEATTERGHSVYKIVTPKAVEKAREQFGCNTLNGVELENQGGAGTAGDHWEKRIYMNDFMTGVNVAGQTTVYSAVTFGLLQDTGFNPLHCHPLYC